MRDQAAQDFLEFRSTGLPRAMARVFDRTAQELLLVAGNLAVSGEDAEELLQVTYLEAMRSAARWDESRPLLPWLLGILVRQARGRQRARAAARERVLEAEALLAPESEDPARRVEETELVEALGAAIAAVPPAYRDSLTLRLVHGLEPREIAHALGRPLDTVKTQLKRGKELLRLALPRSLAAFVVLDGDRLQAVRRTLVREAQRAGGATVAGAGVGGVLAMNAKTIAVGLVVLVGAGLWWGWSRSARGGAGEPAAGAIAAAGTATRAAGAPALATPAVAESTREVAVDAERGGETPLAATELLCRVVWDSDGTPASGVCLELDHSGLGTVALRPTATSDAQGLARFTRLAPGPARVLIDRVIQDPRLARTNLAAGPNEIELRIPRGLTVEGVVLDERDQAVPFAELWLAGAELYDGGGLWTERADSGGRFRLRDVGPGHALAARARGRSAGAPIVVEGSPGELWTVTLRVGAAGPRLRGVVRSDGVPVAGALLFVGMSQDTRYTLVDGVKTLFVSPPQRVSTDHEGRFEAECVPADQHYTLWACAEGLASRHVSGPPELPETFVAIELEPAASVVGTVRDSEGNPVATCEVSASQGGLDPERAYDWGAPPWSRAETWSARDGSFRLERLTPGPAELWVRDARREARTELVLVAGEEARWDAELHTAAEISGIVVDERGLPLGGIQVSGRPEGEGPRTILAPVETDSQGFFRLTGATREAYTLRLSAEGDLDLVRLVEHVPAGSDRLELVLPDALRPSGRLVGQWLDPQGAPFTPESMRLRRIEDDSALRSGGAETRCVGGAFETGLLPPGRYLVTLRDARTGTWVAGPFELLAGERRDVGTLRVPSPGRLECTVLDAGGAPLSGTELIVTGHGFEFGTTARVLDGRARVETLSPGRYWVGFSGYGEPLVRVPVDVEAGVAAEVTLRLPATLPRWIQVPEGIPGHFLVCALDWRRDGVLVAHQDSVIGWDPQRPLEMQLAPGQYEVTVALEDGRSARTSFAVSAETTGLEQAVRLRSPLE